MRYFIQVSLSPMFELWIDNLQEHLVLAVESGLLSEDEAVEIREFQIAEALPKYLEIEDGIGA